MFPVCLELTGRLVVVVGGGPVGRRKALAALAARARVRIVCLEARPSDVGDEIEWRQAAYAEEVLTEAALVFACATPALNAQIAADCRRLGVWVNVASGEGGDVQMPAVLRRGALTVAITTDGASPALARRLRDRLEAVLPAGLAEWVEILGEMRAVVLQTVASEERRRVVLEELADWGWLERLEAEGSTLVREAMRERIARIASPQP